VRADLNFFFLLFSAENRPAKGKFRGTVYRNTLMDQAHSMLAYKYCNRYATGVMDSITQYLLTRLHQGLTKRL